MAANVIQLALGVATGLFGRKMIWILLAASGFALGYAVAPVLFPSATPMITITLGIIFGVVLAVLAKRYSKHLVALAGGVGVGGLFLTLRTHFFKGDPNDAVAVGVFLLGFAVGAAIVWFFPKFGASIASALVGGVLTVAGLRGLLGMDPGAVWSWIALALAAAYLFFQLSHRESKKVPAAQASPPPE